MRESKAKFIDWISESAQAALVVGARDAQPVRGLTHSFYKYPARFSPAFARAAIKTFTRPGDLVLDNHVGGGTTLVEALAMGRDAVGIDISALAEFVSRAKTTLFSPLELRFLEMWAQQAPREIHIHKPSLHFKDYAEAGYYRHLNHRDRWRLRKSIEQGIESATMLGDPRMEAFGRCAVLRTAQWALDGRARLTSVDEFRAYLKKTATDMAEGARELRAAVRRSGRRSTIDVINRSAAGIENDQRLKNLRAPKLILTSPPYPGVHVLYHRWQVDGRKETPLPFMIARKLDGSSSSYYTMGDRKNPELKIYFDSILGTMSSVAAIADDETVIVQMVAFSNAEWQLPRYLNTMREAGLEEMFLPAMQSEGDGRLWRSVPGRRWYSDQRGKTPGSLEVVLIHRKANAAPRRRAAEALTVRSRPSA